MTERCAHLNVEPPAKYGERWKCPECGSIFTEDPFDRFYTSGETANLMVELAQLRPGMRVLEPSAGRGAILRALPSNVYALAVELVPSEAAHLDGVHPAMDVRVQDFLRYRPEGKPFDVAITNPPYSSTPGADGLHVMHALRHALSVVALVRTNFLHGFSRYHQVFRWCTLMDLVVLSRRPSFNGPADSGQTARHDYQIVRLERRRDAERQLEGSFTTADAVRLRFVP